MRAPYFVAAPTAPDDPVVVRDYEQDQMFYRFIDPHTCKLRASFKPGEEMAPIALGEWIARRSRDGVSLFHLATGNQLLPVTRAVPIAIHADAQWLYIVSAFVEYGWWVGGNESVQTAFVERVPRSDLMRVQSPELVATLDLSALSRWNTVSVFSTPSQLLFRFGYHQLDVAGPFALIQLRWSTSTQAMLLVDSAYNPLVVPTDDDVLVQLGNELHLYPAGGSPRLLREDLGQLNLRGLVASDLIAAEWSQKLLALPLDGGAPRELVSDVISADAVSTSDGRVYWTSTAGELWSMAP